TNYNIQYVNGTLTISETTDNPPAPAPGDKDDSSFTDDERTDLNSLSVQISKIKAKTYDITTPYEPVVKVTVVENKKKKTLTEGTDYRVLYNNNLNAGTEATVTVKGNGIYKGEKTAYFTISPKSVKKLKIITGNIPGSINAAYIDDASNPLPVYVYDGGKLLTRGEDYNLSLKKSAAKAITLNVTAVADTNYTGTTTAKLTIYDGTDSTKIINPENIYLVGENGEETPYTETYETIYTGKAIKPAVKVKIGEDGTPLDGKNYKVAYQNNKAAGTAYVIVTGKKEYKGKAVVPFHITTKQSDLTITNVIKDKTYNGKLQKPSVTVKAGTVKLKKNKDYTIRYEDNLHAGKATITVTGKGNYTGTGTKQFNINKQNIKKASVKVNQSGGIDVYYGKRLLRNGSDYTLEYGAQKGKNKIEVKVTATQESDFTGDMTKTVKLPVYSPVLKDAERTIEKKVGETYQLEFEEPESQAAVRASFECESSNPEVVSTEVSADKKTILLTMKKVGTAVISVYTNSRKNVQQCYVVVKGEIGIIYEQSPGTTDDTPAINRLLREWEYNPGMGDYLYIPAGIYRIDAVKNIGGIILTDNQTLIMDPSAVIMAIGNDATNYHVIYAFARNNITISGGQIIGEREEHKGKGGEWGHGIDIQGCTNVHISNVDISNCWGDGICLGEYDMMVDGKLKHVPSNYVTVENCNLHHNRRNNLSITDANNVTVDNCQFNYASGTDPQYGICIEYNYTPTEHVKILNSTFKGNAKASMGIIKKATDVRIENCTMDGEFYNLAGKNVVIKNTTIKNKHYD
ncbi:MAG: right-handed parallel beta-helix repeat-containing protein, partial [Ruminococcus flavefaciens]|nr:right-handed parallel beta-helix repeat-containing protein [Ruminococcus flavefaciens]